MAQGGLEVARLDEAPQTGIVEGCRQGRVGEDGSNGRFDRRRRDRARTGAVQCAGGARREAEAPGQGEVGRAKEDRLDAVAVGLCDAAARRRGRGEGRIAERGRGRDHRFEEGGPNEGQNDTGEAGAGSGALALTSSGEEEGGLRPEGFVALGLGAVGFGAGVDGAEEAPEAEPDHRRHAHEEEGRGQSAGGQEGESGTFAEVDGDEGVEGVRAQGGEEEARQEGEGRA